MATKKTSFDPPGSTAVAASNNENGKDDKKNKKTKEALLLAPVSQVLGAFGQKRPDGSRSWVRTYRILGTLMALTSGALYPTMAFIWASTFASLSASTSNTSYMSNLKNQVYSFLILGSVGFITLATQAALFERAADEATRDLRVQWFQALLRQDMAYFDIKDVSAQATIVSANAIKFRRGVGRKLGEAIQFTCTIIGGIIYAFYVSWRVSLVIMAVVPLMMAAGFFMLKVTMTQTSRSNQNYAEAGSVVYTTLSSIKTVHSMNAVPIMLQKFTDATTKAYKAGASFVIWVGFGNGLVFSSFLASYVALTLYGAYLLYSAVARYGCDPSGGQNGNAACSVTGTDVFGASFGISFVGMMLPQVSAAIEAFTAAREACYPALEAIQRTVAKSSSEPMDNSGDESTPRDADVEAGAATATTTIINGHAEDAWTRPMLERRDIPLPKYIIDSSSELGLKPETVRGNIVLDKVYFSYPTRRGTYALKNVSLTIAPNTTVALVGASGSGKSTIVQLMERFYDPTMGSISLDGNDLRTLNVKWLRNQIGLVSQEPTLFARSIRENIAYGRPHATDEEIIAAAQTANCHDFISSFPQGYDTPVGDKGTQLSGGQKQRIAIARALLKNPKILLLDEATSALDSVNESIVQEALDDLLKMKRTTIVIAHRLSTIRNADVIVVFKDGGIIEIGSHDELLGREGSEYRKLVEAQSRPNKSLLSDSLTASLVSKDVTSSFANKSMISSGQGIPEITFRNVVFSYPTRKSRPVLNGLNLVIHQGETLAIVGSSGGGKSTIIQLIERFYDIDSGSIQYQGVEIKDLNVNYLRDQIGLVSQEPILFNTSIRENIRYGCPTASDLEVEEAAKKANAHEFIMSFPSRYDTNMGETGSQISGGQKQRLCIARALLKKPKILLLDESTSALDSESESHVQRAIDELIEAKMQTVVVVAHRLSTVCNADRIAVVGKGRVLEIGTHEELMSKEHGKYRKLYEYQSLKEDRKMGFNEFFAVPDEEEEKEEPVTEEKNPEEKIKENAKRARLLAKDDIGLLILGAIGAILNGFVFPSWGILFAYLIEVLYHPVFSCTGPQCQAYWSAEARKIELLSYKVTFGWLGAMGLNIIGQTLLYYGLGTATEKMNRRVRDAAFTSLIRQEMAFFDQQKVGNLASQIQEDAAMIQSFSGEPVRSLTMSLSSILVGLVVSFIFMWPFALLTLAILPFMGFGAIMEMKMYWGQEESTNVKNEENSPGAILVETLLNIRTVASLVIEPIREREYSKALAKEDTVNGARTAFLKGAASGSGLFFQMWGMALMFWWGGKVLSDHPTLFSYRDYLISMFSLLFSLTGLSVSFMGITDKDKAKEAAKRIFELIDKKSFIDPLSNDGIKNVP